MPSFASAPELQKNTLSANVACTKPRGQPLGLRHAIEIGDVHHPGGLGRDRLHEMRIVVADRGGRDAGAAIEKPSPIGRPQPSALAPLEREIGAVVGGHQGGDHDPAHILTWGSGA